ncbi:MAG: ribonuclease HI family protein [Actinomycetota bacterium]|nr:ribonuclease HI family protein [Actinomycetota bacterium]
MGINNNAGEAEKAERIRHKASRIIVHCDGLCGPLNPGGTATFGWVARRGVELLASDYGVVARGRRATSNLAEYTAIIKALRWLDDAGHAGDTIVLRSDSQLAIYQLDGTYAVRSPSIRPLWDEACRLVGRFADLRFEWVRRTQNQEADALTRKAYRQAVAACRHDPVRGLDDRSTTEIVPAPPS